MQVFTCRTLRIGWRPRSHAATLGALVSSLGCLALLDLGTEMWVWQLLGCGCTLAAFVWYARGAGRSVRGHVLELVGDSLRIHPGEGDRPDFAVRRVITSRRVADGYALTQSQLVLTLRNGTTIEADLDSDSAREVLEHLGVTPAERTLPTPLITPFGWLETGVDGVRIATVWRSRFVPYGTIRSVTRTRKRIVFETTSGRLRTSHMVDARAIPELVARIEERRAAAALAHAPPLDVLDRGERPMGAWRAALGELARGGKAFRSAALHDDDLQRILDDPAASLEQRIGAALTLRSRGGDAQGRIRVAAGTSVERRVRVALEAAAADEIDERAIERALAKAEPRSLAAAQEPRETED